MARGSGTITDRGLSVVAEPAADPVAV
jgi:hypothetical protein